jgi:hypothetical protein
MLESDAANPAAEEPLGADPSTPAQDTDPDREAMPPNPNADEGDSQLEEGPDPGAEELEDVEWEGKQYKLPRELKPALMMQADYQRKTADLARDREGYSSQREAFEQTLQAHAAFHKDFRVLNFLDHQIEQLKSIDFEALHAEDPERAQRLDYRLRSLSGQRDAVAGELNRKNAARLQSIEAEFDKAQARANQVLTKPDPAVGWNHKGVTPEAKAALEKTGQALGFSMEELGRVIDPRYFKVLNLAGIGLSVLEKQRAALAQKPGQVVKPQPATNLQAKRGKAASSGPSDSDDDDTWLQKRQAQVRAKERSERRRFGI